MKQSIGTNTRDTTSTKYSLFSKTEMKGEVIPLPNPAKNDRVGTRVSPVMSSNLGAFLGGRFSHPPFFACRVASCFVGSSGKQIPLIANYFRMAIAVPQVFQYDVKFQV